MSLRVPVGGVVVRMPCLKTVQQVLEYFLKDGCLDRRGGRNMAIYMSYDKGKRDIVAGCSGSCSYSRGRRKDVFIACTWTGPP